MGPLVLLLSGCSCARPGVLVGMRICVVDFPHTQLCDPSDDGAPVDSFQEIQWNFARAMSMRGHEVIHIGTAGSVVPAGVDHVDACTAEEWARDHESMEHRQRFAARVRDVLLSRGGPPYTSIVGVLWGSDGATADVPQFVVEYGIGYRHAREKWRVYLSHAWRHFDEGQAQNLNGKNWYWQVIPLVLDVEQFGPVEVAKENYLLCLCRMQEDKGVRIAVQVAKAAGIPIRLAGRGNGAQFVREWPEGATYLGPVSSATRRELMRHALALMSPTIYIEPLGASALEAQASGCPVISTDWGGYTETVIHADSDGQHGTGWRCSTFEEFVWAARNVHKIDPLVCREWIVRNHSFERVGAAYEDYFASLLRIQHGGGWPNAEAANSRTGLSRAARDYSMFSHRASSGSQDT